MRFFLSQLLSTKDKAIDDKHFCIQKWGFPPLLGTQRRWSKTFLNTPKPNFHSIVQKDVRNSLKIDVCILGNQSPFILGQRPPCLLPSCFIQWDHLRAWYFPSGVLGTPWTGNQFTLENVSKHSTFLSWLRRREGSHWGGYTSNSLLYQDLWLDFVLHKYFTSSPSLSHLEKTLPLWAASKSRVTQK